MGGEGQAEGTDKRRGHPKVTGIVGGGWVHIGKQTWSVCLPTGLFVIGSRDMGHG